MLPDACRLIVFLLLVPGALPAQAADSIGRHVEPGRVLRIRGIDGARLQGRVIASTPTHLTLQLGAANRPVPLGSIDSLWTRGNAAKRMAIVGALAGGAVSAFVWGVVCDGCDELGIVPALTAAGVGGGAILGAVIGLAIPRWRLRYARASVGLRLAPAAPDRLAAGISLQFHSGTH